eukprot:scaffold24208_cov51-Prasinocladus_malaysianus.AAC.4
MCTRPSNSLQLKAMTKERGNRKTGQSDSVNEGLEPLHYLLTQGEVGIQVSHEQSAACCWLVNMVLEPARNAGTVIAHAAGRHHWI